MWHELIFVVADGQAEAWSDALLECGALSVQAEDADEGSPDEQALFGEPGEPAPALGWQRTRLAAMVDATLANPKSWTTGGEVAMRRIDDGEPSFRVSLASPMTVRANCGYDIELESSCYNSSTGRVYLNLARWVRGDLDQYPPFHWR